MLELARSGQFDTNDALVYATSRGLTMNAGDVAAIVGHLADLGELRRVGRTEATGAQRFELPK
jgi:hypothetical protein